MIDQASFDTYCMHQKCIQVKQAFFSYNDQSFHVKNSHPIGSIHPLQLNPVFSRLKTQEKNLLEESQKKIQTNVYSYIDNFCQKMCAFMKSKYLDGFVDTVTKEVAKFKIKDVQQVCIKLKSGDYNMLAQIIKAERKEEQQPQEHIDEKIKSIDENAKKKLEQIFEAFEKVFEVTFDNLDDFHKIAMGTLNQIKPEDLKQMRKMVKLATDDSMSDQNTLMGRSSSKFGDDQDQNAAEKKKQKRKMIQKSSHHEKKSKPIENSKEYASPFIVPRQPSELISQIAPDEIRVNNCQKPQILYDYISARYFDLKGIHIFHHSFATKEWLKKIFRRYPNLKNISLNCSHEFQYTQLTELSKEALNNIESLQLRWDLNRFFSDSEKMKYFPTKKKEKIQHLGKIHIPTKIIEDMKENTSLAITSQKTIDYLVEAKFPHDRVQTLHYTKTKDEHQKIPSMNKLLYLCSMGLTNVVSLNLSEISLHDCDYEFSEFIRFNMNLTAIKIYYCNIKKSQLNSLLESLQILPNLTKLKFASKSDDSLPKLRPEVFLCHSNLEELYLSNIQFIGTENKPDFRKLSLLKKLTHLSLNTCFPIHSDFMNYFHEETLQNMEYLNLGVTDVDNDFMKFHFPKMLKLQYLDLDQTEITGDAFIEGCQSFKRRNNMSFPPLQYLNLEKEGRIKNPSRKWNFQVDEMRTIGQFLTSLVYLEITNCRNLCYYNFAEFKSLRIVAMDFENAKNMVHLSPLVEKFVICGEQSK